MLAVPDHWVWDFWLADDGERHHMFFLRAPRAVGDPGQRHWHVSIGHAVSADLVDWEVLDDVLAPSPEPAPDDASTWTGSVVDVEDGTWRMFYTGTRRQDDGLVQRMLSATSPDLHRWTRDPDVVVEADPGVALGRHLPRDRRSRGVAARPPNASPRSTAGPTTSAWTRRADCCGRSRPSTAGRSRGPTLMILAGTRALETMGLKTFGWAGGRQDIWAPEEDSFWGPEQEWLADERYSGDRELNGDLAAVQMGLIYVNPEGPNGTPDPIAAAHDIRETFARMAMNDVETVALIAGGHTFGKAHGAHPEDSLASEPEAAGLHEMGFGWTGSEGEGTGSDAVTSGLEGSWTPRGEVDEADMVPDAHREGMTHPPMMFTTDLSLKEDPSYRGISERFRDNPEEFAHAFARAWFKLTHRDMGPIDRYLGPLVPDEELLWQDPVPAVDHELVDADDLAALKQAVLDSDLTIPQLVNTAWSSAATFRRTDMRGGANGARIRLSPQVDWDVNVRSGVPGVLSVLEGIQADFNEGRSDGKQVLLADLVVLAGGAAVEAAATAGGWDVEVPFTPGRTDTTQEQTDIDSFQYLEPMADGFRNYLHKDGEIPPEHLLLDRAFMLELSGPEMAALLGGLRVLGANVGDEPHGVLTDRVGTLSNDFFTNLLDMGTAWEPVGEADDLFEGRDRHTGDKKWDATRVDLVFGSNAQLRAVAEVFASDDAEEEFVQRFVEGWTKVMNLDRYDLR